MCARMQLIRDESCGNSQPYLSIETVELWSPSLNFMVCCSYIRRPKFTFPYNLGILLARVEAGRTRPSLGSSAPLPHIGWYSFRTHTPLQYVDGNWQRLFGYILSDVIGKPVDFLLPSSEDVPRARAAFETAVQVGWGRRRVLPVIRRSTLVRLAFGAILHASGAF